MPSRTTTLALLPAAAAAAAGRLAPPLAAAASSLAARAPAAIQARLPAAGAYLTALAAAAGGGDAARGWALLAALATLAAAGLAALLLPRRPAPVYLLAFSVFRPPARLRCSRAKFLAISRDCGAFDEAAMAFQEKMAAAGGLGDGTYLPDAMHASPPAPSIAAARAEAEMVLGATVNDALRAAGVAPSQIDAVVVNCSLFCPTPSLAAMVVRMWGLRPDVVAYNLGGQGCSAGVIAVGLAQEILQAYPNFRVLVVSTENITQNWYFGSDRSMLIPNALFRLGGAAAVLSNRRADKCRARYVLSHLVRTHAGADAGAYECVVQREDAAGTVGVHLSKSLVSVAGRALTANITRLAPRVLPWGQQARFVLNALRRRAARDKKSRPPPFMPDFTTAFEHFCVHTGGRGVLDELEKQLGLPPAAMAPSRATLARYGNTSSSSIWYTLAGIEASDAGVRRGDRVWQVAFGSGFKCNSAVWTALRSGRTVHPAWDKELDTAEGFDVVEE
jgi:3-ketoacyl-CoA synthase